MEASYLNSLRGGGGGGGGGRVEGRAAPPPDKLLTWVESAYLKLKENKVEVFLIFSMWALPQLSTIASCVYK